MRVQIKIFPWILLSMILVGRAWKSMWFWSIYRSNSLVRSTDGCLSLAVLKTESKLVQCMYVSYISISRRLVMLLPSTWNVRKSTSYSLHFAVYTVYAHDGKYTFQKKLHCHLVNCVWHCVGQESRKVLPVHAVLKCQENFNWACRSSL